MIYEFESKSMITAICVHVVLTRYALISTRDLKQLNFE